jgi:hypothetical protein
MQGHNMIRRPVFPRSTSTSFQDWWVLAVIEQYEPLLVRPTSLAVLPLMVAQQSGLMLRCCDGLSRAIAGY